MAARESWRIGVWEDYAKTSMVADLSGRWTAASIASALHGGFKSASFTIPMPLGEAWLWLRSEGTRGRHYFHLEVSESGRTVWEGRVMDVEVLIDSVMQGIQLTANGYWSALRDRYYDAQDAGNTDWTVGGPHTVDKILKELIAKSGPDISTSTADIAANSRDVVGIDLTARAYPQDIIIDRLAPLSDTGTAIYYAAVWEDRVPAWQARSITTPHWYVYLRDLQTLRLIQQGKHVRNLVLPVTGTAEGTSATDSESTLSYPRRDIMLAVGTGVPGSAAADARDAALEERRFPRQDAQFSINGRVYSGRAIGTLLGTGIGPEMPKWWIRAGDTIRIQDLVPASAAIGTFDDVRTFFILETHYDAASDVLTIQPDRPSGGLDALLPRISVLER